MLTVWGQGPSNKDFTLWSRHSSLCPETDLLRKCAPSEPPKSCFGLRFTVRALKVWGCRAIEFRSLGRQGLLEA